MLFVLSRIKIYIELVKDSYFEAFKTTVVNTPPGSRAGHRNTFVVRFKSKPLLDIL